MKYLGVDYGKKKVGLAISEGELAAPFKVLDVTGLEDALLKIKRVVEQEGVEVVIIGQPDSGESRNMAENFKKSFSNRVEGVQILWGEETLSSKQAVDNFLTQGFTREKRGREDAESAAIILQGYLDSNR